MNLYKVTGTNNTGYIVANNMCTALWLYNRKYPSHHAYDVHTVQYDIMCADKEVVPPDYTIKIKTKFCERAFELSGSDEYSIKNLIDIITESTQLHVDKNYLVK